MRDYDFLQIESWNPNKPLGGIGDCFIRRNDALKKATPKWSNKNEIRKIYEEAKRISAKTGIKHDVDHIFPIQGKTVSGLHVIENLQIIPASENRKKSNRSIPEPS